jgi:hypothetical protein
MRTEEEYVYFLDMEAPTPSLPQLGEGEREGADLKLKT